MKSMRDYCNQSLNSLTMSEDEKKRILSVCLDNKEHRQKNIHKKHNKFSCIAIVTIVLCFVLIRFTNSNLLQNGNKVKVLADQTVITFDNGAIYFMDKEDTLVSENKMCEPNGDICNWSYEQVCEYMNKDIYLHYLPKGITIADKDRKYPIYIDKNNTVTFDNIEVLYQGKDDSYINVIMSKGKLPMTDEIFSCDTHSHIGNTNINMCTINSTTYRAEFVYQNIGYIITSNIPEKEEFVNVLKDIIK